MSDLSAPCGILPVFTRFAMSGMIHSSSTPFGPDRVNNGSGTTEGGSSLTAKRIPISRNCRK